MKCYCKENKVCNINKEGFHKDNYCLRDENCYNYLPCWGNFLLCTFLILVFCTEKRMTKEFNETCVCNNGLDGTNTCEFVEKKYDPVRFQLYLLKVLIIHCRIAVYIGLTHTLVSQYQLQSIHGMPEVI